MVNRDDQRDRVTDGGEELETQTVEEEAPESEYDAKMIISGGVLKTWLDQPATVVEEAKVRIDEDGLRTRAVDPANVCMTYSGLETHAFESFNVGRDRLIGVRIDRLVEVIKPASGDELVKLAIDDERRYLIVEWGGYEWDLAMIDPDSIRTRPDLPDLDLPTVFEVGEAEKFKEAVGFADEVADHIRMWSEMGQPDVAGVSAEGDTDTFDAEWVHGDEIEFHEGRISNVSSLLSLDYMKDISAAWQTDKPLTVNLGDEFPLDVEAKLYSDSGAEVGWSQFMLAPRIQSD